MSNSQDTTKNPPTKLNNGFGSPPKEIKPAEVKKDNSGNTKK